MYLLYIMVVFAYLMGSLSFAIIISKMLKMDDPRSYGSKNAGATNVMRSGNKKAAILTLVGDFLKGFLVVIIARLWFSSVNGAEVLIAFSGIVVVLGHIYPIFFKFKGGKGVATALGVLLGFNLWLMLLCAASWLIVFKLSRISSLSAIVAAAGAPVYAYLLMGNSVYFGATLVIAFFILYTHKANILRIVTGKEQKFKKNQDNVIDTKDQN